MRTPQYDLRGRTCVAKLHLRVRFGVADEVRTFSVGLIGSVWIFGAEVAQ
jgi:hypothetical protein